MSILDEIIVRKKERLPRIKDENPFSSLERESGPVKPFLIKGTPSLIAECKKASPSKGLIAPEYDPAAIAKSYQEGGASAVSVLTEEDFFLGSSADFINVRSAISLPMIRKDFMIDPYQIRESWAMGADAVLLIAAALSDAQMKELYDAAQELGLGVLAEAHDENEIMRCLALQNAYIGINARNLKNFAVDLPAIAVLRELIPADRIAVAESGVRSFEAAAFLRKEGFDAFLVGEFFMNSDSREEDIKRFVREISQ